MQENRSGRRWLRWLCRGGVALVVLVLLLFFGSNLVMGSGWFRGKIEGRLTGRTRLAWTVEEASWSPWGGVRVGKLRAVAAGPEAHAIPPIVEIGEILVQPYWKDLLSGKIRVRELRVTEPVGKLPLELLVQLMRSDGRVDTARLGTPVVAKPGPSPDPGPDPGGEEPDSETSGEVAKTPDEASAPKGGQPKPTPKPVAPVPAVPDVEPSGRLIVVGGDLELYSLSAPGRTVQVAGVRMDVPFSGGEAEGVIEAVAVKVAGKEVAGPVQVPLRWKQGVIEWPKEEFEWEGLTVQTAGAVRIRGRLLGAMEMRVIAPKVEARAVPGWEAAAFQTGPVEMRARLTGDLIRPVTWQGNLVAGVRGVQLVHQVRGESLVFDQARLVTDLRGGVLQLVDGTLGGEQLSLFANGLMVLDGRVYGVGRVVASPDVAEGITRVAAGSMVSPGYVRAWMSPLGTPDRYYRDIYVRGTIQKSEFDLGPEGRWMDGERALRLMRMFVTREEAEEEAKAESGGEGAS